MLSPFVAIVAVVVSAVALAGCGVRSGDGAAESVLTAELVVPPAQQEIAESPTASPVPPTATIAPPRAPVEKSNADETAARINLNVPNRGYNAMGSDDAPITMFDFSDFL